MPKYTDFDIPITVAGVTYRNPFFVSSGPTTMSIEQLEKIQQIKEREYSHRGWYINRGQVMVATVWYSIGGTLGLRDMFRRLAKRQVSVLDDGRVIDHVSADDVALVEKVEYTRIAEAHEDEGSSQEPPAKS